MSEPRALDPTAAMPAPWRNGLGSTRELASRSGDDGALLWRISLAALDGDAAFSVLPGLDRVFVALGSVHLQIGDESHLLALGDQRSFPGEAAVRARVDAPTQALNVMTRRGRAQASVVLRDPAEAPTESDFTVDLGTLAADIRITPSAGNM